MEKETDYRIGQKVVATIELEDRGQDFTDIDLLANGVLLGNSVMFSHGRLSLLGIGTVDGREYHTATEVIQKRVGVLNLKGLTVYLKDTGEKDPFPWKAQTLKYPVVEIKKPIKPNRFLTPQAYMLKDTPDGTTHYFGDGCGIKEHNPMTPQEHNKQVVEEFDKEFKQRTIQQNKALYKWFELLAEALNDGGFSIQKTLRHDVEIPWTKEAIKILMWHRLQEAMFPPEKGKVSTTQLTTKQIDQIYDVMNKAIGERTSIHIPFPSEEDMSLVIDGKIMV